MFQNPHVKHYHYAGTEPRRNVKMQVEWHEKHILLKVAFPLSAHSDKATFEIPYGSIERPTRGTHRPNRPSSKSGRKRWADLSDSKHGFSLLNDSKYGYDVKGNVLRLSLLRSPEWPDPHADEGSSRITYSCIRMGGKLAGCADRCGRGYELNYKPIALPSPETRGNNFRANILSCALKRDNVVLTALKKSEDDDSLVLRFMSGQERDGCKAPASGRSAVGVRNRF